MHKSTLFLVLLTLISQTLSIKTKKSIVNNKALKTDSIELPTINLNVHIVSTFHSQHFSHSSARSSDSYNSVHTSNSSHYESEDSHDDDTDDHQYGGNHQDKNKNSSGFIKASDPYFRFLKPLVKIDAATETEVIN